MRSLIQARTRAAAEASAGVLSGLFTVFYLSYVLRHWLDGRVNSLAELYDRDSAVSSATLVLGLSLLVFVYILATNRQPVPFQVAARRRRPDMGQGALAGISFIALLVIFATSPSTTYEGLHQHIGQSSAGKLLYLPYVYFSYLLAQGLRRRLHGPQVGFEFVLFALAFTILVPMRSPILTHAITLFLIYRPPLRRLLVYLPTIAAIFVAIAVLRSANGRVDNAELLDALGMFIFGPSLQIDLYQISLSDGYRSARDLYEFLATRYSEYFDEGGGFGSFITLELEQYLPGVGLAPFIVALAPLLLRTAIRVSPAMVPFMVIAGVQALTILRNPMSSWINGFLLSLFFYVAFRRLSSYR
jgi:hypothetical protein